MLSHENKRVTRPGCASLVAPAKFSTYAYSSCTGRVCHKVEMNGARHHGTYSVDMVLTTVKSCDIDGWDVRLSHVS